MKKAPSTRIYMGFVERNEGGPGTVRYEDVGGVREKLNPRCDLRNHSPDGFQWGYAGSGPAQLSLALVADASGDDRLTMKVYQKFKFNIVARLQPTWKMTAEEVMAEVDKIARQGDE
jgi:hypothetical protein